MFWVILKWINLWLVGVILYNFILLVMVDICLVFLILCIVFNLVDVGLWDEIKCRV